MWANSVYTPKMWSIALLKKPVNGQLTADQQTYNYWVSKVSYVSYSKLNELYYLQIRIQVEHTIGLLKGTFQSLKSSTP